MTDEQQKALINELVAIRAGVATKADLLKLEEGLTEIIVGLARSIGNLPTADSEDNPLRKELTAWMEVKDAEIARLNDRINVWVKRTDALDTQLNDRLGRMNSRIDDVLTALLTRIETLEALIAK